MTVNFLPHQIFVPYKDIWRFKSQIHNKPLLFFDKDETRLFTTVLRILTEERLTRDGPLQYKVVI